MAGRGTARIDLGRSGSGPRVTHSIFATRAVRLGPPANDNTPALRTILRMTILGIAVGAVVALALVLLH